MAAKQSIIRKEGPDQEIAGPVEYDRIACEYKASKQLAFRINIEEYTLFNILGNIGGKHILDFACGEGHYTRRMKTAGAKNIVGIDLSREMIELAKATEITEPLGCQYIQSDISAFRAESEVDIVVAMYLLNYAKTRDELSDFCSVAFNSIRSGGRFIGLNDNIGIKPMEVPSYEKYGFTKTCPVNWREGDAITYCFANSDGSQFEFNNYYLSEETYRWALNMLALRIFVGLHP